MGDNKKMALTEVSTELDNMLNDFLNANFDKRQKALLKGAEFLKSKIEENAPVATGEYKASFVLEDKYKDKKYVGNTKTVKSKSSSATPLSNVLEYGGKPHIRIAFDTNKDKIYSIIREELAKEE